MNKLFLTLAVGFMSLTAAAETAQMVFKTVDGTSQSITAAGLDISFTDTDMVATNGTQTVTLPLSDLTSMQFTGLQSGMVSDIAKDGDVTIVNINGMMLGTYSSAADAARNLASGIYIVRYADGKTSKLIIRK